MFGRAGGASIYYYDGLSVSFRRIYALYVRALIYKYRFTKYSERARAGRIVCVYVLVGRKNNVCLMTDWSALLCTWRMSDERSGADARIRSVTTTRSCIDIYIYRSHGNVIFAVCV